MPTPPNCTIKIEFDTNRPLYIDEVMLVPEHQETIFCGTDNAVMINGFRYNR